MRKLNQNLETFWSNLAADASEDPKAVFTRSVEIARNHGLPYVEVPEVAQLPLGDIRHRLKVLKENPTESNVTALLGGAPAPQITLTDLLKVYESVNKTRLMQKSPAQLKRWRNERYKAIKIFRDAIGRDLPLNELTRDHARAYCAYWNDKATAENEKERVTVHTCNTNIGSISAMLKSVVDHHHLNIPNIFQNLRLAGDDTESRIPFDPEFIQKNCLPPVPLTASTTKAGGSSTSWWKPASASQRRATLTRQPSSLITKSRTSESGPTAAK